MNIYCPKTILLYVERFDSNPYFKINMYVHIIYHYINILYIFNSNPIISNNFSYVLMKYILCESVQIINRKMVFTFSRGVYCGWWWGMTGLLALVLYATRKAHLLKSLLLGPLVCNKLLWKNSASPTNQWCLNVAYINYLRECGKMVVQYMHACIYVNWVYTCI